MRARTELELDERCCRWARDLADLLNLRDQVLTIFFKKNKRKMRNTELLS